MDLLLLLGRNVHVVAVEVRQVGIRVTRCTEGLSLESDGTQREDGILTVHDAVAVVDEDIRYIYVLGTHGTEESPDGKVQEIFGSKPEELGKRAQRVVVRLMQDGIALGYA